MIRHEPPRADSAADASPGAREGVRPQDAPPEGSALADLGALGLELARWLQLRAERSRLAWRRRFLEALWALPFLAFGLTVAIFAGVHFARGVVEGGRAIFARAPWLGELAAGAGLLVLLRVGLHLWMRALDARELARLRAEHEEHGDETHEPSARPPAA